MGLFDNFKSMFGTDEIAVSSSTPTPSDNEEKSFSIDSNITTARELASLIGADGAASINPEFDYASNVRAAYVENVVSYFCLQLITNIATQPRWELYVDDKLVEDDNAAKDALAIRRFIQRPNVGQSLQDFIKQYFIYQYLAGETFIRRLPNNNAIKRGNGSFMLLEPGDISMSALEYKVRTSNNTSISIPKISNDKTREVLHVAEWHPYSDRGLSALSPAWVPITNYNSAQKWNAGMLNNSARLSLLAVLKSATGTTGKSNGLNQEQIQGLSRDLEKFAGPKGRGKPMVISGDWDFKEFGLNQQEIEFIGGMEHMSRAIALAYGVDPVLLSLPGDTAYNNKRDAMAGLFKLTVLPKLNMLKESYTHWMKEIIPGNWELKINMDDIPALEVDREKLWSRQKDAIDILTINERRELLGFGPLPDGDVIAKATPAKPIEEPKVEEVKPEGDVVDPKVQAEEEKK